jgi:hypothetical protein
VAKVLGPLGIPNVMFRFWFETQSLGCSDPYAGRTWWLPVVRNRLLGAISAKLLSRTEVLK